jgi:5-deoxy-glucuronate isomerase
MTTAPAHLHFPAGRAARDGFDVVVTPEIAGWTHTSLRILTLSPGGSRPLPTVGVETIVVPLEGGATMHAGETTVELAGRSGVFSGPTDVVYLPPGLDATLASATGGRFALCAARTDDASRPVTHLAAADVPTETRGAGASSRLVRNFATADVLDAASVIACEVVTPAGNWSSYPAHKHDEAGSHEAQLEEIYYFEIAAGPQGQPGFGFHRTFSSPGRDIDVMVEVHDRDVALVPFGWHGPSVAAPGYDMYYLNVMAGPDPGRRWMITDHPDQAWIRSTWSAMPLDARLSDGSYGR